MAGIKDPLEEIDVAEVHDCFTWTEITNYEDLGFAKKGEGAKLIEEGRTALTGDIPVNPSGGLQSFGSPHCAPRGRLGYQNVTQPPGQRGTRLVKKDKKQMVDN